jgi:hypothetical protein
MTDTIYVLQYCNILDQWCIESYTRSIKEAKEWRSVDPDNRFYTDINEYVPTGED